MSAGVKKYLTPAVKSKPLVLTSAALAAPEFEDPEEYVADFKQKLDPIPNDHRTFERISSLYEELGFSEDQFYLVLKRLFIK